MCVCGGWVCPVYVCVVGVCAHARVCLSTPACVLGSLLHTAADRELLPRRGLTLEVTCLPVCADGHVCFECPPHIITGLTTHLQRGCCPQPLETGAQGSER